MKIHELLGTVLTVALVAGAGPLRASTPAGLDEPIATEQVTGTSLTLTSRIAYSSVLVRVAGPQGYEARRVFEADAPLHLDLLLDGWQTVVVAEEGSGPMADGEASAEPPNSIARLSPAALPDGRYRWEAVLTDAAGRPRTVAGEFSLLDGSPAEAEDIEEDASVAQAGRERTPDEDAQTGDPSSPDGASLRTKGTIQQDYVHIRDTSDDGHTHLVMYSDTSSNELLEVWQISNRQGNFMIEESWPAQRVPFFIRQDSQGEIGIGTTAPGAHLHVAGTNPALRVEDVAGSLVGAWDMRNLNGNLHWFDQATGKSVARLSQGGRANALVVASSGEVGFGTAFPEATLHVVSEAPSLLLDETNESRARFRLRAETEGGQRLFKIVDGGGATLLALDQNSGALTVNGDMRVGSSRHLKEEIEPLAAEAALETLAALEPVTYRYRSDPGDRHVGFIAEDVPELVAAPGRKALSPMDMVALLTRVVQEQQLRLERQAGQVEALRERLDRLAVGAHP